MLCVYMYNKQELVGGFPGENTGHTIHGLPLITLQIRYKRSADACPETVVDGCWDWRDCQVENISAFYKYTEVHCLTSDATMLSLDKHFATPS